MPVCAEQPRIEISVITIFFVLSSVFNNAIVSNFIVVFKPRHYVFIAAVRRDVPSYYGVDVTHVPRYVHKYPVFISV